MKDGFVTVGAATPDIKVGDIKFNADNIIKNIQKASKEGIKLLVFPELCLSAYTCSDLFFQRLLLNEIKKAIKRICDETAGEDIAAIVGAPIEWGQKLYNCGVVINRGHIKGIVPKTYIPNYSEFYEMRHFTPAPLGVQSISFLDEEVPFGTDILFEADCMENFVFAVEICEDLWSVNPPSNRHAEAGATVIANLSCSDELIGKEEYRSRLVSSQSARLYSAYVYADAGEGESTTDLVFSGDNIIAENGKILKRGERFENGMISAVVDVQKMAAERLRQNTYRNCDKGYVRVQINLQSADTELCRQVDKHPFIPQNDSDREKRCEEILTIQSMGLKKRLSHTWAKTAVIGISGGLDSTLAMLVAARAADMLSWDRKQIIAVTMPCFGTTDRTYTNAVNFSKSLGVTLKEINIREAVLRHFRDIEQPDGVYDVTYENAQARERTQVLMDIANQTGGLVVGTGDLSELALGWATYNGDHMSMYGVNAGVPKTLIRYLVDYEAKKTDNKVLETTLNDILATPVSPELLPAEDGKISQKTEHIVGPYELHDFFLYHLLRFGETPGKILRLAVKAFEGDYEREFILGWLKVFFRRFISQQYKRSCVPDGPKVGSVGISPRGD